MEPLKDEGAEVYGLHRSHAFEEVMLYVSNTTSVRRPGNTGWNRLLSLLTAGYLRAAMRTQVHGGEEGPQQPPRLLSMEILSHRTCPTGRNTLHEVCSGFPLQTLVQQPIFPKSKSGEAGTDIGLQWAQSSLSSRAKIGREMII